MRVALFQYDIEADPDRNLDKIASAAAQSTAADLLVLPEVCLTGFGAGKNAPVCDPESPRVHRFMELAAEHRLHILAGLRFREGSAVRNRAVLFGPNGIEGQYDKRVLFSHWHEQRFIDAGEQHARFSLGGFSLTPVICYELRFPEVFREQDGSEVYIVIANWPESRREHWLTLLRARAIENQAYVIGVNRVGKAADVAFCGDSLVYAPDGTELLHLGSEASCQSVNLSKEVLTSYRREFPFLQDRLS